LKVLIQHIENILPGHDCVVVPGLGGFVQNRVSAHLHQATDLFYPESKEICFNAKLRFNDGLLAQSYQEAFGMSFEEANLEIRKAVQEIIHKLEEGKYVRLGRVGTLSYNEGQILFRPDHQNPFFPEVYGLSPFSFPRLKIEPIAVQKEKQLAKSAPRVRKEKIHKEKDEFITIRLRKSRFRQFIVGTAACLFLLMLSKPTGDLSGTGQQAGMMHDYLTVPLTDQVIPADTEAVDSLSALPPSSEPVITGLVAESTSVLPVAYSPHPEVSVRPSADTPAATEEDAGMKKAYYIVVSTFSRKATAEIWLSEHLENPALGNCGIIEEKGWARVYTKSFTDKQQAQEYLTRFVVENPDFASAWVYSGNND
jgi:hypothetical protein